MKKDKWLLIIFALLAFSFSIYSYSQVDLNLTLSKNLLYQAFQEQMTYLGYFSRGWSTQVFLGLSLLLLLIYFLLIKTFIKTKQKVSNLWLK